MQEKPMELTKTLAKFIVETDKSNIPSQILEHTKVAFMDWLSVTLAGKDDPLVGKLIKYSDLMGGYEQATVLGYGVKKTAVQTALINGAASHALDFDDTLESIIGHPSVTLFPSLLAFSEWKEKSGLDMLTAYVIGFKVATAIGTCGIVDHYMSGWHSTCTLGHFASAAGCARLMGLNEQQTLYALGIAGTQASGLKRVFGTMCKPFHAGKSSMTGLMSALLASEGFDCAEDILEGTNGFLQVLNGKLNNKMADTLGKTWDIENLAQKYHSSCHATHSPIEAVFAIVEKEGLNVQDIGSIKIFTSRLSIDAAGKTEPTTGLAGKFSIPYCVANALLRGNTGMQAFTDEKVNDPQVQDYMKKISLHLSDKMDLLEAKVDVETDSGKTYTKTIDVMKDIPDLETKKTKIKTKFMDLCPPVLGEDKAEKLIKAIESLEDIKNMQTFIDII